MAALARSRESLHRPGRIEGSRGLGRGRTSLVHGSVAWILEADTTLEILEVLPTDDDFLR
jgi:hypothetical protein